MEANDEEEEDVGRNGGVKDGERNMGDNGVERGRGRGVHLRRGKDTNEDGGTSGIPEPQGATSVGSAVDEVVGAAVVFKANARDVRMYSSCALLSYTSEFYMS